MLSRTAEYALRAVLLLARNGSARAKPANEIADALGVPRNYLSKTLNRLAKRGVLMAVRGPGGGYRLAVQPSVLAVSDVVSEFDHMGPSDRCVIGERSCDPETPCEVHDRWQTWSQSISRVMQDTTVADFLGSGEARSDRAESGQVSDGSAGAGRDRPVVRVTANDER